MGVSLLKGAFSCNDNTKIVHVHHNNHNHPSYSSSRNINHTSHRPYYHNHSSYSYPALTSPSSLLVHPPTYAHQHHHHPYYHNHQFSPNFNTNTNALSPILAANASPSSSLDLTIAPIISTTNANNFQPYNSSSNSNLNTALSAANATASPTTMLHAANKNVGRFFGGMLGFGPYMHWQDQDRSNRRLCAPQAGEYPMAPSYYDYSYPDHYDDYWTPPPSYAFARHARRRHRWPMPPQYPYYLDPYADSEDEYTTDYDEDDDGSGGGGLYGPWSPPAAAQWQRRPDPARYAAFGGRPWWQRQRRRRRSPGNGLF